MRRSRWLMMMLAALLVWWAARVVPQALALATATVNFGGSLRVGGNIFLDCTPAVASRTLTRPKGNKTASATARVNCTNRMNIPVTVDVVTASLTPPANAQPTWAWSKNSIPLAAGNPAATGFSTLTVTVGKNTTAGTYTLTYTTTVNASNGLSYTETHTLRIIVR